MKARICTKLTPHPLWPHFKMADPVFEGVLGSKGYAELDVTSKESRGSKKGSYCPCLMDEGSLGSSILSRLVI